MGAGWVRRRRVAKVAKDLAKSFKSSGWSGPIPEEEAAELQVLKPCQASALLHIRRKCHRMHREALPYLVRRTEELGFTVQDLERTLAYIREQSPVIIHLNLGRDGSLLVADTHYRNLFEVRGDSCEPNIHAQSRMDWEDDLFGGAYRGAAPVDRCKYGVLNATNDPQGVRICAPVYGSSYLLLRGVRLRTTLSAEDSAGLNSSELATVDRYAHVLARYTDEELQATLEVGTRLRPGVNSLAIRAYKEAQIHGEIRLSDHVALIMVHPSLRESSEGILEQLAAHCNAPLVWMEGVEDTAGDEDEELRLGLERSREEEELKRAIEASRGGEDGMDEELRLALEASCREAGEVPSREASSALPSPSAAAVTARSNSSMLAARDRGLAEAIESSRLASEGRRGNAGSAEAQQCGSSATPRTQGECHVTRL